MQLRETNGACGAADCGRKGRVIAICEQVSVWGVMNQGYEGHMRMYHRMANKFVKFIKLKSL